MSRQKKSIASCQLIDSISQNKSDNQLLSQFTGLLVSHIRFEERILFNHLQEIMGEEELVRLLVEVEADKKQL